MLLPLPGEDDSLLGRILLEPPQPGQALEEVAAPNPCADKLEVAKRSALAASFENAEELAFGAHAKATLSTFGFAADVERATHFVYKVDATARLARTDTTDYRACCAEKGCGYGYVSALVSGDGEYASAEEARASADVNVALAAVGGEQRLRVLHRRKVRGFLAALVQVTDPKKAGGALGALGLAQQAGITEEALPATMRTLYDQEKVWIDGESQRYKFAVKGSYLTENEFARRYVAVTGANDVTTHHRSWGYLIGGLSLVGVAVAGEVAGGVLVGTQDNWKEAKGIGAEIMGFSLVPAACGTAMLILSAAGSDGTAEEHTLSAYDAQLAVQRYNRALLRKASRDLLHQSQPQSAAPQATSPSVAVGGWPGGISLQGRF